MRDEEAGLLLLLPGLQELGLQLRPRLGIERAERLVHEQYFRIHGIGTRDCDTLLHAARKLLRIALRKILELYELDVLLRNLVAFFRALALELEAELDIVFDREPRKEGILLEHDATVGTRPLHRLAVDRHRSRCRLLETADDVQKCRLAAAGRADHADELVLVNIEADTVQGGHLALAGLELLDDIVDMDPHRTRIREVVADRCFIDLENSFLAHL